MSEIRLINREFGELNVDGVGYYAIEENLYDAIEQLQQENEQLKSTLKGTTHCYDEEEHQRQNNILTEFEKWLEEELKRKNARWEQFRNQINTQELVLERLNAQIVFIDCCLKRIQELKEGEIMNKGIIIKFDKENGRKFYDDWNKKIDYNLLVISLLETLNDICKYYNLDIKQQMDNYLKLGSCDDYIGDE